LKLIATPLTGKFASGRSLKKKKFARGRLLKVVKFANGRPLSQINSSFGGLQLIGGLPLDRSGDVNLYMWRSSA